MSKLVVIVLVLKHTKLFKDKFSFTLKNFFSTIILLLSIANQRSCVLMRKNIGNLRKNIFFKLNTNWAAMTSKMCLSRRSVLPLRIGIAIVNKKPYIIYRIWLW